MHVASQQQGLETFSLVGRSRPRLKCELHSQRSVQREGGGWEKNPRVPVGVSGEEGERTVRGGGRRGCSVPEGRGGENCETGGVGLSRSAPPRSSGGPSWGACSAGQTPTAPEPSRRTETLMMCAYVHRISAELSQGLTATSVKCLSYSRASGPQKPQWAPESPGRLITWDRQAPGPELRSQ